MWNILLWTGLSLPLLYLLIVFILRKISHKPAPPTEKSLYYLSAQSTKPPGRKLTSIRKSGPTVEISVVIPAYNEESRLKNGLNEALDWLEDKRSNYERRANIRTDNKKSSIHDGGVQVPQVGEDDNSDLGIKSYEVLIVDDGSSDRTIDTALELAIQHSQRTNNHPDAVIRVISLGKNRGKGGAVRHGILHSRGEMILFADADGATKFSDLSKLIKSLKEIRTQRRSTSSSLTTATSDSTIKQKIMADREAGEFYGIAIGSRAHLVSSPTVVSRSKFRNFLMKAFHLYLILLGLKDIRDTQCGFKLMTRATAIEVFEGLHVERWIFDVELLLRAQLIEPKIPIVEVPIEWEEVSGSKLSIFRDSIVMAMELFLIRINYFLGIWELV